VQGGLFDDEAGEPPARRDPEVSGTDGRFQAAPGTGDPGNQSKTLPPLPDPASLSGAVRILFQVSADAYDSVVYAWLSRFPIEAQAVRYALRVLTAAKQGALQGKGGGSAQAGAPGPQSPWYACAGARRGAAIAATDRQDSDCGAVLTAAYKVAREVDRLMGFLRFSPDAQGRYIARCAPDHFVLPILAFHFSKRFGDIPWAVIDERRGLALVREGGEPRIVAGRGFREPDPEYFRTPERRDTGLRDARPEVRDPFESLWRCYHGVISIEGRKNLSLQRQFIPRRYRDYLTEFEAD
jgi:probable DNA metabolism protein